MSALDVLIDGVLCGRIEQSTTGNLTFVYDSDYRNDRDATPLSLSLPLTATSHRRRAVLPFLQGLLPDSEEALRAIGRRFDANPANPFALLRHVGTEVAGAVQLVEPGREGSDAAERNGAVQPMTDAEVALMLEHVSAEYADGVASGDVPGRFSLAGAQPKIALHRLPSGAWGIPLDATPTTHILKPVVGSVRRIDVVEQMTMRAAAHLGNDVAHSELATIDGLDVFVTERYDRTLIDGQWRRLHQEDLCQALAVSPSKKYQHRDGVPGLADVARLLRSLPLDSERSTAGREFYRALVFNIVAAGTDAHAKNFSLLLHGRSVRLAPLYDLITYAPYWNGTSRLDSAMSVAGEYSLARIGSDSLTTAGRAFGVNDTTAAEIVDDVRTHCLEAFDMARAGMEGRGAEVEAFAHDVVTAVARLPLVHSRPAG